MPTPTPAADHLLGGHERTWGARVVGWDRTRNNWHRNISRSINLLIWKDSPVCWTLELLTEVEEGTRSRFEIIPWFLCFVVFVVWDFRLSEKQTKERNADVNVDNLQNLNIENSRLQKSATDSFRSGFEKRWPSYINDHSDRLWCGMEVGIWPYSLIAS